MSKGLVSEKEEIKCSSIITLMMLQKKAREHNPNWPKFQTIHRKY